MTRRSARRLVHGAFEIFLGLALLSGLGMVGTFFWADGRATQAANDERNSHWQGVVGTLQAEHAKRLAAETAKAKQQEDQWLANILTVGEALAKERAANARLRGDMAAVVARADRVRSATASAATGGRTEAEDSTAAARDRAAALGRSLGEALLAHEECSGELESARADTRALLAAWPRDEVALPQP